MGIKRSGIDSVLDLANNALLILFLIGIMYPIYYLIVVSFSDLGKIVSETFVLWPRGFNLDSYRAVLKHDIIWRGYLNSFLYLIAGVAINVVMTILAAYPLSREDLVGGRTLTKILVMTMYFSGGLIPSYLVVRGLGMVNTFAAMVIPNAVNAFMIIIAISFFKTTIPKELQEQGKIDGCSDFLMLIRIVLPLSTPLIGVLALQYGLGSWNSYAQALIYLSDPLKFPLQLVLRDILIVADSTTINAMMSHQENYEKMVGLKEGIKYVSMVLSCAPLLIIYPFLSKFFEKGITLGAVKE